MMHSVKKRTFLSFGLSLCFLLMALLLTWWFIHRQQPGQQRMRLEKRLAEKESLLIETIQITGDSLSGSRELSDEVKTDLIHIYEREGVTILIYEHDSLIFWSSNAIPLDNDLVTHQFASKAEQLRNGWYLIEKGTLDDRTIMGLWLIKGQYPYQNKYLDNTFNETLRVSDGTRIARLPGENTVCSLEGEPLFSLIFPDDIPLTENQVYLVFFMYLMFLLVFIHGLFMAYQWMLPFLRSRILMFLAFTIDVLIIRILLFYFRLPHFLYQSDLFKSIFYGSSQWLPSLGDLVVNALLLLLVVYVFFVSIRPSRILLKLGPASLYVLSFLGFILVFLLMDGVLYLFKGLILDSSLSLNLNNLFDLTFASLLGYGVMACLLLCFFLVSYRIFTWIYLSLRGFKQYLLCLVVAVLAYAGLCQLIPLGCDGIILSFLLIFMLSLWLLRRKDISLISFYYLAFFLLLFSVVSTYMLHTYHREKEKEHRKWMAMKLSVERDKIAEYMFAETAHQIRLDSVLQNRLWRAVENDTIEQEMIRYIEEHYMEPYLAHYQYQITLCGDQQILEIQPGNFEVGCEDFFIGMVEQIGKTTAGENFYFLDDGTEDINYLAVFQFPVVERGGMIHMYLELYSKYVPKALGYPELLIDQKATVFTDLTNYSYAIYHEGILVKSVGKYFYPLQESAPGESPAEFVFFDEEGYNHLFYAAGKNRDIIVSKQRDTFWGVLSPFSYLIIFYGAGLLLFLVLSVPSLRTPFSGRSFKNRIQLAVIAIILTSFLVIGMTSLFYLANLNNSKNLDILSEKTHSVLIELEHKLAAEPALPPELSSYLDGLLHKFSQVFFSDIHLYSLDGNLLASSRREIFKEGLQSAKMNPQAYQEMAYRNKTVFMHQECIGRYEFLSAYVPFRNNLDQTIAYLNLPYFARQTEIRQEISTFLTAFINIYIILIAIAIFIALFISGYITQPMQLIREKMRKLRLGKTNEKIDWPIRDEIGNLIGEYNRMIDELATSAELLARSERESAWREMAKQVAHEIKNPLTPMKLSIQYLQKAWDERAPDWEQRLKRFTETIIQQIDNLSVIASEFSDFAKMPQTYLEKIDLKEVVANALGLFSEFRHIEFIADQVPEAPCYVYADRKQMLRVFNNLIKNSVQAIPVDKRGKIEIEIRLENDTYLSRVTDNGIGIPQDLARRIFSPSFTTKTGGMGMGLAIVKSIIINTGGEIWFESEEGIGTTFYIRLPVCQETP